MSLLSEWRIMFIRRSPVDEDVSDSHFLLWRCPKFALNLLLMPWNHACSELCFTCIALYIVYKLHMLHEQNPAPLPPLFLAHWSSAHPDGHPRSYACIVCICPAVSLIPPALLLCPPAQEQGWEKMNGDVWAEEARMRGKNERMTERGEAVLEWLWDKWGSERGQGQGWGKQSISLTHTLRDILRLRATLLSTPSLGKRKKVVPVFLTVWEDESWHGKKDVCFVFQNPRSSEL